MTLDEYLKSTPVTAATFAERIGVSPASVTRIRNGGQNIPLKLAKEIVSATGGKVTLEDLAVGLAA